LIVLADEVVRLERDIHGLKEQAEFSLTPKTFTDQAA